MIKKQSATALILAIFIAAALFINPSSANTQTVYTIQSSGNIQQNLSTDLTVILRSIRVDGLNPNQINITAWVDSYVGTHSYATAVTLCDMHQYGIWWYGYSFSQESGNWMGWTFQQLKTIIDRFHSHGWKVGLETTGIAWNNQQEYEYITTHHPELAFTDANGLKATGIDNATLQTKNPGYNKVIPDFFAMFSTDDEINNITAGTRLIDVYTTRLTQMINDGIQWDFWFGTDGWNGFLIQGYNWNIKTASSCYSFSVQEENEFGNWSQAILPENWEGMNQLQKATAITANTTILSNWWFYWQTRFAQMYAQIREAFIQTGRQNSFYTIGTVDESSEPAGGGYLGPNGMYNMSLLAEHNSIDFFYTDQEKAIFSGAEYSLGREQAYAGALAKMQNPSVKPIIGLQLVDWMGNPYPPYAVKQEYLSQAINYVWYSGERYRVCDPSIVMVQYPDTEGWPKWNQSDVIEVFNFIKTTSNILKQTNPMWLGPVYPIANSKSGAFGMAWWGLNFSISQWTWTTNLINNPQFVSEDMGTFLADEAIADPGPTLTGLYDNMINQMWANDKLNIWYYKARGPNWGLSTVWPGYENEAQRAFHIQYSPGTSLNYSVLNGFSENVASSIAQDYEGTTYINDAFPEFNGAYIAEPGFVSIASFTYDSPNRIAVGYYTNSSTGKFLLTHMPSGWQNNHILMPRNMINKMLYWVSDCPITTSESLIDLKVLTSGSSIIIPMTDQKNVGSNFEIPSELSTTLNLKTLGLNDSSEYNVYWASDPNNQIIVSDWNNITVTLQNGADILVISPK